VSLAMDTGRSRRDGHDGTVAMGCAGEDGPGIWISRENKAEGWKRQVWRFLGESDFQYHARRSTNAALEMHWCSFEVWSSSPTSDAPNLGDWSAPGAYNTSLALPKVQTDRDALKSSTLTFVAYESVCLFMYLFVHSFIMCYRYPRDAVKHFT
jgi:hypothetical protein